MKQFFKTQRDVNGNIYTLEIDHDKKTYKADYNSTFNYTGYIKISKRDRHEMMEELNNYLYTREY